MPTPEPPRHRIRRPLRTAGRLAAVCTALLAAAVQPPSASADGAARVTPASVDAVVQGYREATGLPGVAVAVTRGTEVVHADGYGSTPSGAAVTARTPMAVASVSKSFTALAVLQLVEAGEVELDAPVHEHLPEFTMADPRAADITVRQLLNQTSGMSDSTFPAFSRPQPATLREAVRGMRTAEPAADPGTHWEYHNPNFQVAARLVEVVGGRPFADHLEARVFEPLGMEHSLTVDTDRDLPPSAHGHLKVLGRPVAVPEPSAFGNGSGGVVSTADDMAAWLIMQSNEGRGADGARIVSADSITQMRTPSPASGSYALGWSVDETESGAPIVEHSGDLFTSTAHQALLPRSGYGVAVMANTGMAYGDAQAVAEALIAVIEGREPPAPSRNPVLPAVDAVFLVLSAATVLLAGRGVRRSRRWAAPRTGLPPWRTAARLLPLAVPPVLFATVDQVVGFLYRGRDVAWPQVSYLYPAFMVFLGAAALGCTAVAAARIIGLARVGRVGSAPSSAD
ncbi:CubicO group peptidase (beta-lactamase class C family) [Spinactinospora alkalitolerans]|uniref:CubicO group peptidase (Beta-lactamase class C family) n=1 Tax=Spinactinospora alkalitolerans TaxID=687207 RepID=A0A852U0R3_9ACTN|nr:serine hydrolase domain-containing protein [Spinactinospora alkalitolerans]NYE47784.1 CubicO group peptidase (beta-lactamase class C family) [Spinactinospora alkalitolerans]